MYSQLCNDPLDQTHRLIAPSVTGVVRRLLASLAVLSYLLSFGSMPISAQQPIVCNDHTGQDVGSLLSNNDALTSRGQRLPDSEADLLALACVRWELWKRNAIAREGPGMPLGSSWLTGAAAGAWAAVRVDPGSRRAAIVMAELSRTEPRRLASQRNLDGAYQLFSMSADPAIRILAAEACVLLGEWLPERSVEMLRCAAAGMLADSTTALWPLATARAHAMLGDAEAAWAAWRRAAQLSSEEPAWSLLRGQVRWFATAEELRSLDEATGAARPELLTYLPVRRDAATGAGSGSYLVTHFRRLATARREFALDVPRGQEERFLTGAPTVSILWAIDSTATLSDWRELRRWQLEVDDRGAIYVRHGPPDARVHPVNRNATIELWHYERTMIPMSFQFEEEDFDGSAEATRLVAGRYGSHWCGVDARRCLYGMGNLGPTAEQLAGMREDDRHLLSASERFDTPSDSGALPLPLIARGFRVWDSRTGAPILLVSYAVPWPARDVGGHLSLPLRVRTRGGSNRDTVVVHDHRAASTPEADDHDRHAMGFAVIPRDQSAIAWSAELELSPSHMARATGIASPPTERSGVSMSDIVASTEDSPIRWSVAGESQPIDPGMKLHKDRPLHLFYQVRYAGDRDIEGASTRIQVLPMKSDGSEVGDPTREMVVEFPQEIHPGINDVGPLMDAGRLRDGIYLLEVLIIDTGGIVLARASTTIELVS